MDYILYVKYPTVHQLYMKFNTTQLPEFSINIWKPPNLSDLTPIMSNMGLTHLNYLLWLNINNLKPTIFISI